MTHSNTFRKKFTANDTIYAQILKEPLKFDVFPENTEYIIRQERFSSFHNVSKKYHDEFSVPPSSTVSRIILLLRNLLYNTRYNLLHHSYMSSMGIGWIVNAGIYSHFFPLIEQGGKSTEIGYAFASAYAELMERVQFGDFFSKNPYKKRLYYTLANTSDYRDITNLPTTDLKVLKQKNPYLLLKNDERWDSKTIFKNINSTKNVLIPSFLTDTFVNGLGSGNCYEEAFLHAFYELIERYYSSEVLLGRISLLSLDSKYLNKKNQRIVKLFEINGFKLFIGVVNSTWPFNCLSLIVDMPTNHPLNIEDKELFSLTFGCSSDINVSFSKAISEFFQLSPDLIRRIYLNEKISSKLSTLYAVFPHLEKYYPQVYAERDKFHEQNCISSQRIHTILTNQFIPSHNKHFKFASFSNIKNEIDFIMDFLHKNKINIYMRDYNWIGFPTLQLFIPQLFLYYKLYDRTKTIRKLIYDFIKSIKYHSYSTNFSFRSILGDPEFILYAFAHENLASFFNIEVDNLYHYNTFDFLSLLSLSSSNPDIAKKFMLLAGKDRLSLTNKLTTTSITSLLSILSKFIPTCPFTKCSQCNFRNSCKAHIQYNFEKQLVHSFTPYFGQVDAEYSIKIK